MYKDGKWAKQIISMQKVTVSGQGCLDGDTQNAFMEYALHKEGGIYYIYDGRLGELPQVFESKRASNYLGAIEGQTPKTQILSANMYELEILRLLVLLSPNDPEVKFMVASTLNRLKTTCFGYRDDGLGECFDASLVVLRFLITAAPQEDEWIQSRIDNYKCHCNEKKRPRYCE